MAIPKHTTTRTYVCKGRINQTETARLQLDHYRRSAGSTSDVALECLQANYPNSKIDKNDAQKLTTLIRQERKESSKTKNTLGRRAEIAIVEQTAKNWNNHIEHNFGRPRFYNGAPVTTIPTYADGNKLKRPLIVFTQAAGRPVLHIPECPAIRLDPVRPLPEGQPTFATVTVKNKQINVSLVYRIPQEPLPQEWDPAQVLGLDLGITELVATNAGISYSGIRQQEMDEAINDARRFKESMRRKAVKEGKAGYKATLDQDNRQIRTATGKPKRHFHWVDGKETAGHRSARHRLTELLAQRKRQRRHYRHQVAAQIVKFCVEQGIQLIAYEKLNIQSMTKSAKGTVAKPGKKVAQKRSLNRRILDQGWGELLGFAKYKARYAGIRTVGVYAGNTSNICAECGLQDRKSRKRKKFLCTGCGHQADADANASRNIAWRGTQVCRKWQGARQEKSDAEPDSTNRLTTPEIHPGPGTGLGSMRPKAHPPRATRTGSIPDTAAQPAG